ncbi:MAG: FKBP-type peptidyl-prolyl cis-trans isomerase [Tannerella sp.]|jgi:peptidylprolyl isomerase/FKBP-type peptidyl-prolyl cis-trans isomerase FklB|nr:FKBP-type peptidyl-prolyl cis-trans isomerase [Tannerella sp.]
MKKINLYTTLLLLAAIATSCSDSENDDAIMAEWKAANEQAWNEITRNPEYTELKSPGNNGSIYYRVLKKGDGQKKIYYTSRVGVYYKGWFVASSSDLNISKGKVFDQKLFDDGTPSVFAVSIAGSTYDSYYYTYTPPIPTEEGWTIALQHMVKGDKWEIWIPSQLAHGKTGKVDSNNNQITPGYSTLAFEIEVTNVAGIDGDTE